MVGASNTRQPRPPLFPAPLLRGLHGPGEREGPHRGREILPRLPKHTRLQGSRLAERHAIPSFSRYPANADMTAARVRQGGAARPIRPGLRAHARPHYAAACPAPTPRLSGVYTHKQLGGGGGASPSRCGADAHSAASHPYPLHAAPPFCSHARSPNPENSGKPHRTSTARTRGWIPRQWKEMSTSSARSRGLLLRSHPRTGARSWRTPDLHRSPSHGPARSPYYGLQRQSRACVLTKPSRSPPSSRSGHPPPNAGFQSPSPT